MLFQHGTENLARCDVRGDHSLNVSNLVKPSVTFRDLEQEDKISFPSCNMQCYACSQLQNTTASSFQCHFDTNHPASLNYIYNNPSIKNDRDDIKIPKSAEIACL